MKRIIHSLTLVIVASMLFVACGGKKARPLIESVSSFLNGNTEVIAFGSAQLGEILKKTDYEKESKIKAFLNEPLTQLSSSFNIDAPMYFAVSGPIVDGNPSAVYLFLEIKDQKKLQENLEKNGFEIENGKDFQFVSDGDMLLSFDEKLALVVIKADVKDGKALLTEARNKTFKDVSTGQVASILGKSGDIVLGASLENLYGTSNTDLNKLSEAKQKELKQILDNSYVESIIKFQDGELTIESKNHFSNALKNKLFLNKDANAKVLDNLGNGSPRVGVALNLDAKKLQEFLDDYAPDALSELSKSLGGSFAMAMMVANNDISKLIDGRVGALIVGEAEQIAEGMTPDFNFFVGLAGQGKTFGETLKSAISNKFKVVNLNDAGIAGFSSADYAGKGIVLSEAATGFGQNSLDVFIDLDGIDMEEFMLDGAAKLLELVKYVRINYNADGGKIIVKAKDGKDNILKQCLFKGVSMLEDQLAL